MQKMQETQVRFLGQKDPLEGQIATHFSIFCLGNSVDRGAWRATVHGVVKSQTQLITYIHVIYLPTNTYLSVYLSIHLSI